MKIYPSKHRIKKVEDANIDKDVSIALAYLDEENVTYKISSKTSSNFLKNEKIELVPGMKLEHEDVLIFDEFGNPVSSDTLINREGDSYYYYPNNITEIVPLKFSYNIIIQKDMNIKLISNNKYYLNLTFLDDKTDLNFANRLSKILVAPDSKVIPSNIVINNNTQNLDETFLDVNELTDFVFVESNDGLYYNYIPNDTYLEEGMDKVSLSIDSLLNQNKNIWIVSDDHYKYPVTRSSGIEVDLKNKLFDQDSFMIKDYYNVSEAKYKDTRFHNIFKTDVCPILIEEHLNRGFTIYSSSEIFQKDNIIKYRKLIYEVLLYVYSKSYKTSEIMNECITYDVPDYEYNVNRLDKKSNYITKKTLNEMLKMSTNDYKIKLVNIFDNNDTLPLPDEDLVDTVSNIVYRLSTDKLNEKSKLIFELNKNDQSTVYIETPKKTGWKSVLYNEKVYYMPQIHYLIETKIPDIENEVQNDIEQKLFLIKKDLDLVIRLYPIKSSKNSLNIQKDLRLTIPYIKTIVNGDERIRDDSYVLYIDRNSNTLNYELEEDYEPASNKVYLSLITISKIKSDKYITDMRRKGGGLPEDMPDNFNLLDIGHIYGRPYRQANTLVITLPKKYEPYKNEILEVINKYKVAEDYPILFFEDDETDGEI
jgi:hypothetical protein